MAQKQERYRVVVVGAGVVGLSAAVHLYERFGDKVQVTVVADGFSPDTTGDKAGMLMYPTDWNESDSLTSGKSAPSKEQERCLRWARSTFQKFHSIYRSEANADVQLVLRPGYIFRYSSRSEPSWKDLVFGFRHVAVESEEARAVNAPSDATDIWTFLTYILNCSNYLEWLMSLFREHGGLVEKRKISSFNELDSYDIIVNCTGLGSHELLGDRTVQPARGQHILVEAPWATHFAVNIRDNSGKLIYVQPRVSNTILGGMIERNNWSKTVDPATKQRILDDCKNLIPSLSKAKIVDDWACLRPLRPSIRLEREARPNGTPLIHCYGHGGQGGMLSWGCALDIGDLVAQTITEQSSVTIPKAKL